MITQLEREASSLRICCELVGRIGAMSVVEVCAMSNGITEATVRKALARGIELGYLRHGEKKKVSAGKGNARKTYVRTRKQLPGVIEPANTADTAILCFEGVAELVLTAIG